jgi:hypothetical protein
MLESPAEDEMKKLLILVTASVSILGCKEDSGNDYDPALLAEYREAIPSMDQLRAEAPAASTSGTSFAVGQAAIYPSISSDVVLGINGAVGGIINLMRFVVDQPPTLYNSDTREFLWGPFPNDDGVGYAAAYVRDAGAQEDFRYHYALLRGPDQDLANLTPVIWGGATPDANNDDHGAGVTLWDFEANRAFESANNPDYDPADFDAGRFAAVYGRGDDPNNVGAEIGFVVAVFRNFVSKDNPTAPAADLDYLYGRYDDGANLLDFIDFEAGVDVDDPADGLVEDLGIRMAFINEGTGRAEVDVSNGTLGTGVTVTSVECWDTALLETYLNWDGAEDGVVGDCGLIFENSLDALAIPKLQDIDAELMTALDDVAENGVPSN